MQKKKHQKNVKVLKETLKSYEMNLFDSDLTKFIVTDIEAWSKFIQGLLKAPEEGNKLFPKFVETGLLKKHFKYLFTNYMPKCRHMIEKN